MGVQRAKWAAGALGALAMASLGAGCGGSFQGEAEQTISREEFPLAAGTAYCRGLSPCCAPSGFRADQDACAVSWATKFETVLSQRSGTYRPDAAKRCLDVTERAGSTCLEGALFAPEVDDACLALFLPDPSRWTAARHGARGDACSATCERGECFSDAKSPETQCYLAEHLVCGSSGECEPARVAAQACSPTQLCERGLVCRAGKCAEAPFSGPCGLAEDCAPGASCVSGQCVFVNVANESTCGG